MSVRKGRSRVGVRTTMARATNQLLEAYAICECCRECLRGVCDGALLGRSCDRFCVCENPIDDSQAACEEVTDNEGNNDLS